jgi:hypothetical protein
MIAVPISIALDDSADSDLTKIEGTVKEFVCCSVALDDEYADDEVCDLCEERAGAFIIETDDGSDMIVKFGPWWYWETQEVTVRDVVGIGDTVRVTGELCEEEDVPAMDAWYIENLDTGEDITIKVEGCPPWAGGPKELGIDPWPPPKEED